jgi:hypothetical protein
MDLLKAYHGKLNFSKFLHTFADDFLCRSFGTPSLVSTDIFQDPKYTDSDYPFGIFKLFLSGRVHIPSPNNYTLGILNKIKQLSRPYQLISEC